jgi:hypothetical protein
MTDLHYIAIAIVCSVAFVYVFITERLWEPENWFENEEESK